MKKFLSKLFGKKTDVQRGHVPPKPIPRPVSIVRGEPPLPIPPAPFSHEVYMRQRVEQAAANRRTVIAQPRPVVAPTRSDDVNPLTDPLSPLNPLSPVSGWNTPTYEPSSASCDSSPSQSYSDGSSGASCGSDGGSSTSSTFD